MFINQQSKGEYSDIFSDACCDLCEMFHYSTNVEWDDAKDMFCFMMQIGIS